MSNYLASDYYPLCETYANMSLSYYEQYREACSSISSKKMDRPWNILEHSSEENQEYITNWAIKLNTAITAIVFQALSVEAYINLYGVIKVGEDEFYEKYESKKERLSTIEKLKKMCKDKLNKNYPTREKKYNDLVSLLKKRDRLVHVKPRADKSGVDMQMYYDHLRSEVGFVFNNIDDEMLTYHNLKANLAIVDGSGVDIITAMQEQDVAEFFAAINSTYSDILGYILGKNKPLE